jgi:hypothetical protein
MPSQVVWVRWLYATLQEFYTISFDACENLLVVAKTAHAFQHTSKNPMDYGVLPSSFPISRNDHGKLCIPCADRLFHNISSQGRCYPLFDPLNVP